MTATTERGARALKVPPPLVYLVAFLAGLGLHAATGDSIPVRMATAWLGAVPILIGVALGAGAIGMFVRARTTIIPHHRVSALVTSGPYRVSRNPMYASLALICLGSALVVGTWWPLVTVIPALWIIRNAVIAPEERYLEDTFGADYRAYEQRVRRWL